MLTAAAAETTPERGLSGRARTMPTAGLSVAPLLTGTLHFPAGSVLPPPSLVGRGYSLKGSKYVPCLIFQGSLLKLINPSSVTF